MNENISLGRIFGIHVGFNWSLLVVAALIAWSLATGILPSAAPGETSSAYWTAGVVSAFVFLASLLAHELAHSVVAVRRGVKVEGITLWLFGGVSRFSSETNSPGSQALITFVGPLTSLVLGVVFYLVAVAGLHQHLARTLQPGPSLPAGWWPAAAVAHLAPHWRSAASHPNRGPHRHGLRLSLDCLRAGHLLVRRQPDRWCLVGLPRLVPLERRSVRRSRRPDSTSAVRLERGPGHDAQSCSGTRRHQC